MSRLAIACSWWISAWALCCGQACAPAIRLPGKGTVLQEAPGSPWAVAEGDKILFKLQLQYGKKLKMGGLLLIKALPQRRYRLVFLAEVGLVLADFELAPDTFIVHRHLQAIRNPAFFKTVENDFRLLLLQYPDTKPWLGYGLDSDPSYRSRYYKGRRLVLERSGADWTRFAQGRSLRIDWESEPAAAKLRHYFLPLSMDLRPVPLQPEETKEER